jgi:hypothetical protein
MQTTRLTKRLRSTAHAVRCLHEAPRAASCHLLPQWGPSHFACQLRCSSASREPQVPRADSLRPPSCLSVRSHCHLERLRMALFCEKDIVATLVSDVCMSQSRARGAFTDERRNNRTNLARKGNAGHSHTPCCVTLHIARTKMTR